MARTDPATEVVAALRIRADDPGLGWLRQAADLIDARPELDRYELLALARKELREMQAEWEREGINLDSFRHGIAVEAIDRAEDAVFNALNVLKNHCDDERAGAVIHQ